MCGSCMWLAMKFGWGIPMGYGTVAGCDFNEHRKQLGVGGGGGGGYYLCTEIIYRYI